MTPASDEAEHALADLRAAVVRGDTAVARAATRAAVRAGAPWEAIDAASGGPMAPAPMRDDPLPLLGSALGLPIWEELHGVAVPVTAAARDVLPAGIVGDLAMTAGHVAGEAARERIEAVLTERVGGAASANDDPIAWFAYRTARDRVRLVLGATRGRTHRIDETAAASSHELSNALTAIAAIARKTLDAGPATVPPEPMRMVLGLCDGATDTVRRIRSSRPARSSGFIGEPRRASVDELAVELVAALSPFAEQRDIAVALRVDAPVCVATIESDLRSTLFNLVKNAIEASPTNGQVTVTVTTRGDLAEIVVADDGPGMDEAQLALAMEPFYTSKAEGSGIGLPLVRDIVHRYGGELAFDTRPGAGCRVVVRLPCVEQSPAGSPSGRRARVASSGGPRGRARRE